MKIKYLLLVLASATGFSSGSTLQLTTGVANATILNDSIGNPFAAAAWGIVVDTGGDGFGDFSNELLNFTLASSFIGATDDFFYLAANPTLATGPILGAATQVLANYDADPAVVGSQNYKILWIEGKDAGETVDASTLYGLSSVTSLLPASNAANPSVTDFQGENGNSSLAVVPEPSTLLLSALGALALLRRKR